MARIPLGVAFIDIKVLQFVRASRFARPIGSLSIDSFKNRKPSLKNRRTTPTPLLLLLSCTRIKTPILPKMFIKEK